MKRALSFDLSSFSGSHHFRSGLMKGSNARKGITDRKKVLGDHNIDHRDSRDRQKLILAPFVSP